MSYKAHSSDSFLQTSLKFALKSLYFLCPSGKYWQLFTHKNMKLFDKSSYLFREINVWLFVINELYNIFFYFGIVSDFQISPTFVYLSTGTNLDQKFRETTSLLEKNNERFKILERIFILCKMHCFFIVFNSHMYVCFIILKLFMVTNFSQRIWN